MNSQCRRQNSRIAASMMALVLLLAPVLTLVGCGGAQKKPPVVVEMPKEPEKLTMDSAQGRVMYGEAMAALEAEEYDEAMARFEVFVKTFPQSTGARFNMAMIHVRAEAWDKAEAELQALIKVDAKQVRAWNQLGIVYRQLGRLKDARQAYEKAIEIDPSYARAHLNLGILLDLYLQELPQALGEYQAYQKLLPEPDSRVQGWIVDLARRLSVDLGGTP